MSDGAWEKMPQYLFKNFVICGADPNDQKISIQPLKRTFESLYPTPSESGGCSNYCAGCGKCKILCIIYNHSYYQS